MNYSLIDYDTKIVLLELPRQAGLNFCRSRRDIRVKKQKMYRMSENTCSHLFIIYEYVHVRAMRRRECLAETFEAFRIAGYDGFAENTDGFVEMFPEKTRNVLPEYFTWYPVHQYRN